MNVLFVCSRNRLRSPTAEALLADRDGVNSLSAGTAPDAESPLSAELIEWADIIFAMETIHHRKIKQRFGSSLSRKRVIVLGIPDKYCYMDPELVKLIRKKIAPFLPPVS